MKSSIHRVSLLLLLGAIINVGVAWGCVIVRGTVSHTTGYFHNPSGRDPLAIAMNRMWGYEIVTGVDRSGTLLSRDPEIAKRYSDSIWWNDDALKEWNNNFAIACGWPALSLTSWRTMWGEDEMRFPGVIHRGVLWQSIVSSSASGDAETFAPILALQPLWPGFAIDTIFYGTILWVLFAAMGTIRRRRRIRRGLCPKCAYDLQGRDSESQACPECGDPLKPRTGAVA